MAFVPNDKHRLLIRALYRSTLRHAALFDKNPALKACLVRPKNLRGHPFPSDRFREEFYCPYWNLTNEVRERFKMAKLVKDTNMVDQLVSETIQTINLLSGTANLFAEHIDGLYPDLRTPLKDSQNFALSHKTMQTQQTKPNSKTQFTYLSQRPPAPLTGTILVAHPLTADYFKRSLIFIYEHDTVGAKGFVINRPLPAGDYENFRTAPVPDRRLILDGGPVKEAKQVNTKLTVGFDLEKSKIVIEPFGRDVQVISSSPTPTQSQLQTITVNGICVWRPGQLETEFVRGVWMPVKASGIDFIHAQTQGPVPTTLSTNVQAWHTVLKGLGGEFTDFSRCDDTVDQNFLKAHLPVTSTVE